MDVLKNVSQMAANCNHFGMCKIDFLDTGVCGSGTEYKYVAYYPQGRMEIVNALSEQLIPVTEKLLEIADTCNLCGICDRQCRYLTKNRPLKVMKALKEYVKLYRESGKKVERVKEDDVLKELRSVVGRLWATNDPAILISYSRDKGLFNRRIPKYVVMVETSDHISAVVKISKKYNVPYTLRSNGSNAQGLALGEGIIIDFNRMKKIEIDPDNYCATIEPGVTAFDLQKEANKYGLRACVAEPAACVCCNILFSRLNTVFTHAYGMGGDLIVDAEFVDNKGHVFCMNDPSAPNLYCYNKNFFSSPYFMGFTPARICSQMKIKLFPMTEDEEGFLIPFDNLKDALALTRDLGRRRIGFAAGVVSTHYMAFLMTLTSRANKEFLHVLRNTMKIEYFVLVLGDKHLKSNINQITDVYIDQNLGKTLMMSIHQLYSGKAMELIEDIPFNKKPYEIFFKEDMVPLLNLTLSPSEDDIVRYVDDDLKSFYKKLFSSPNMSDMVWLNMFRINSARIGRDDHYYPFLFWASFNDLTLVEEVCENLSDIGKKHGLESGFGYTNTIDFGKWFLLEFDYFFDGSDEGKEKIKNAFMDASEMVNEYVNHKNFKMVSSLSSLFQGQCRTETLLYA